MRLLVLAWAVVELLQIVVIGLLVVAYRNFQRKVDGDYRFTNSPPRSVTEE